MAPNSSLGLFDPLESAAPNSTGQKGCNEVVVCPATA